MHLEDEGGVVVDQGLVELRVPLGFRVQGLWIRVYGLWFMAYGLWLMV